ncbi:MAG: acyl-CoA synthetase [Desulfobacterium sp.]|nr:acyl-CoA synthetase [Desulfobacterium sp.]MBU3948742.1 acetate--CoA ligase family protein [Pseudomonadota bacterium]MBU4036703.1 acetate--CoA ligase family protein [Pseudomonadota bacterium]
MPLDQVLNAESVAIVGASKTDTKRGFQAIRTLLDGKFEGKIYPVNPKENKILGISCYKKVSDIKEPVDIALITTPASTIRDVLIDCGKKGVAGAVIIAGGFRELGEKGRKVEEELMKTAREQNIRLIGPNTSGMMNLKNNLNLVGLHDVPKGDIALISQSGNMALSLITEASLKSRKGFSYYVGVGNELDIRFHEYLEFFKNDPDTKAILMYVEGMRDGRRFLQEAYKTTLHKPIILLKSGRSRTGQLSAGSHTGALAGISEVSRSAFTRAGIIVVEKSDALFPVAETLSNLPLLKNNQIAILADGGGHATIAADILSDFGVLIPELSEHTQQKLTKILPFTASVRNPVDVAGGTDSDPTLFAECAKIILKDHNVGGLLMVGLFGGYGIRFAESLSLQEEDAAHQLGKLVKKQGKPIVVHSLYSSVKPRALDLLRYYKVPVYDSLDVSCRCIAALSERGQYINEYHAKMNFIFNWRQKAKPEGASIINEAIKENRRFLLEPEAKQLLRLHGAAVSSDALAKTADEAVKIAEKYKDKVALKIVSPDILHKSDAGGVLLNLNTESEIRKAFDDIMHNALQYKPDADIRGVLVSPMAKKGLEIIIGTKIDDQFGPVIMFGLGGIMVEVLKDVSFRVLPISPRSAKHMMEEIKGTVLLNGIRGEKPYDKAAIKKLLLLCSELVESYPEIMEMDLNPVIVYENGIQIVDARIILNDKCSLDINTIRE